MNIFAYKTTLLSWKTFKKFFSSLFQAVGVLATLLGILDILFPTIFALGYEGVLVICVLSLLWGLMKIFPKLVVSRYLSESDSTVIIKVGDLFKQDANLVIGMSDAFDTEKGNIIKGIMSLPNEI